MPAMKMRPASHKRRRSRDENRSPLHPGDIATSEPQIKSEPLKVEGESTPHPHHQEKRRRVVRHVDQDSPAIWSNSSLQHLHQFSATRSISPISQILLDEAMALGYFGSIHGGNPGANVEPAMIDTAGGPSPATTFTIQQNHTAHMLSHGLNTSESVLDSAAGPTQLTTVSCIGQSNIVGTMSTQTKVEEGDSPIGQYQSYPWHAAPGVFTTPGDVPMLPQHVYNPELYATYATDSQQQYYLHEGQCYSTPCTPVTFGYGETAFSPHQSIALPGSMLQSPAMPALVPVTTESYGGHLRADAGNNTHVPAVLWSVDVVPGQQYKSPPPSRAGKRGPFRDPLLREQTAQTRKRGSCIRCKMQRIRCETNELDPDGTCLTCKRVTGAKAGRFPCLRYKITDIALYKQGQVPGYEWTNRWDQSISDEIKRWASTDVKVIRICEGYSEHGMLFKVRKFIPEKGDKLERTWDYRGTKMSARVPPYALVDMEEGKAICDQYINDSLGSAFKAILGPQNGILMATYQQAMFLSQSSTATPNTRLLLQQTLRLWMAARLSTKTTFIIGEERLGMPPDILDNTNPTPGKIPVPPVFGAQIDVILIHHIQARLRQELLERLQETIFQNKQANWFVTYLVIFILLHNTSLIIEHDANYAKKHGMKRRFAREAKVKEYHTGANILLAHFHYCNKGVYPFSEECRDNELQNLGHLNDAQIRFIRNSRAFIGRSEHEWHGVRDRGEYESPWYYVSQMYQTDWKPIPMDEF